jgi:hypothetical protein
MLFNIGKAQHVNWKSASSFNAPTGAAGPLCTLGLPATVVSAGFDA